MYLSIRFWYHLKNSDKFIKNIDEIFWNENDFLKNEMNFYDNIIPLNSF